MIASLISNARLTLIGFWAMCFTQLGLAQDTLKFENQFEYTVEALNVSTPFGEKHTEFLGKILNQSTLSLGSKHSLNLGLMIVHDNMPSALRVGDLQTFSNLEAGNLYGFNELYYQFKTENLTIKVGGQDINTDFFVTENGLLFAHSSMGIDPVATVNMPTPTYPFTGFSVSANWNINKTLGLRVGVFDGQFANARNKFLPVSWTLSGNQGFLYLLEPEVRLFKNRLITKVGAYHHSGFFPKKDAGGRGKFWGFYNISDLKLSEIGQESIHFYYQINATSKALSDLDLYYGLGFRFVNVLRLQKENELGIGLAHASINTDFPSVRNQYDIHSETVLEINWKVQINNKIALQPYFQYINIKEIDTDLKEPVVFALRAYFNLEY